VTRLKAAPLALAALVLTAGAVLAFRDLPSASAPGLSTATEASGHKVPVRPVPTVDAPSVESDADAQPALTKADLPDAAAHGSTVSGVATGDDPTPDTNKGADVSAAAKDNHGQSVAATAKDGGQSVAGEHRPAEAGRPADPGSAADDAVPDGAGKPADAGKPDGVGAPADPGQPEDPGAPEDAGKPEDAGPPTGRP
jgi:hypothetical protein